MEGTDEATVRAAVESGDSLPGTAGFAGRLDDALVRDVLGRYPLFVESGAAGGAVPDADWSADPTELADPDPVPAGHVRDADGTREVWSLPDPDPFSNPETAVEAVRDAVETSIDAVDADGLAIAFSGGVDSALLAARLDAPLYVAGFPDSHDVEAARSAAELLGRDLRVVELTHDAIERAVPGIVAATGRTNAMAVQIALPLYLTAERVAADGFDRLALGQGADELFGGYAKVAKAPEDPRVDADTVRGAQREVVATLPDQLSRDVLTLRAAGVEPVTPLLHDRVVSAALRLDDRMLVDGETRKWALRQAALGSLPAAVAMRDKKAAQYGSLAARELDRLARQAGYKRRMDDHVTQYVESLVE
ncbi:asparagine synthase-related protein [Halomicroarcula sp. S1AR25-4]|uniref:asparagine synthase C-terminal domain-containing protein n=1 Tax=Haloarcula sp. S1AR25-4 TaxID=2950538 RepID=UPI00287722BF|nr:asparagine synthase-related protein [Halomicroarcula sp. S1AR25-4]MDS0279932.1 asparagine synthase-related protein [Halomicroarcula sp. S1AR25-4]